MLPAPYYQDDAVTIYHGDCRELLPRFGAETVEIAVTSPPYNLVREWSGGGPNSGMKQLEARYVDWYSDNIDEKDYQAQQRQVITECLRVARSSVFYNHKVRYAWKRRGEIYHPIDWLRDFPIWCEIIWDRGGAQGGNSARVLIADERIFQLGFPKKWNGANGYTTVWRLPPADIDGHVCAFPLDLPKRCMVIATDPGDTVLDPYMGVGTTLRAAKDLGRKAIGIEIEERYCEIAAKRMSQSVMGLEGSADAR